jgi:5-methylcytosine-specific restriction protein A
MYAPNNLCALCHDCHVKVHTELGRSGKEATRKRNDEHVAAVIKKFF